MSHIWYDFVVSFVNGEPNWGVKRAPRAGAQTNGACRIRGGGGCLQVGGGEIAPPLDGSVARLGELCEKSFHECFLQAHGGLFNAE